MCFLKPARALGRSTLLAVDGEIGSLEDLYFEDLTWGIRYLVGNSRGWRSGRQVLISSVAVGDVDEHDNCVHIELTRGQIFNSPPVDTGKPVSRQYEVAYFNYYAWPPYWECGPVCGLTRPDGSRTAPSVTGDAAKAGRDRTHLRSATEVKGSAVAACDGLVGFVEDFIVDVQYWVVRYLQIDTQNWWPGKRVLLHPSWVEQAGWRERMLNIDLTSDLIKTAPGFDPSVAISRDYEARLFRHYGRRVYWQQNNNAMSRLSGKRRSLGAGGARSVLRRPRIRRDQ